MRSRRLDCASSHGAPQAGRGGTPPALQFQGSAAGPAMRRHADQRLNPPLPISRRCTQREPTGLARRSMPTFEPPYPSSHIGHGPRADSLAQQFRWQSIHRERRDSLCLLSPCPRSVPAAVPAYCPGPRIGREPAWLLGSRPISTPLRRPCPRVPAHFALAQPARHPQRAAVSDLEPCGQPGPARRDTRPRPAARAAKRGRLAPSVRWSGAAIRQRGQAWAAPRRLA